MIVHYYEWVNAFVAYHPEHGFVWGDFEDMVRADSEDGFLEFLEHFEPREWDYAGI